MKGTIFFSGKGLPIENLAILLSCILSLWKYILFPKSAPIIYAHLTSNVVTRISMLFNPYCVFGKSSPSLISKMFLVPSNTVWNLRPSGFHIAVLNLNGYFWDPSLDNIPCKPKRNVSVCKFTFTSLMWVAIVGYNHHKVLCKSTGDFDTSEYCSPALVNCSLKIREIYCIYIRNCQL